MSAAFAGQRVVITGGSSGIGADAALAFAQSGAKVWISGRRATALAEVAATHENITAVQADVSHGADVERLFSAAGSPDIVVANAGIATSNPLTRIDRAQWDEMIAVNLTGVFLTMQAAARSMTNGFGRIIAVSSIAGFRGLPYAAHYSAAKHGVIGLVRATSLELARSGVTVNAVCPGYVNTAMTERSADNIVAKTGKSHAQAANILAEMNKHGRLIDPAEVTDAILWLAGRGAGSVNGQIIGLTGGDL